MSHAAPMHTGLTACFCVLLVTGNLLFQKFVDLEPLGLTVSVGVLGYPVTFLLMDLITECHGLRAARQTIHWGLVGCALAGGWVKLADTLTATAWSPVPDTWFHRVFGHYDLALVTSWVAVWCAQHTDAWVFHQLKRLTQGRHLWLRNNLSTGIGQAVDTTVVVVGLAWWGLIPWAQVGTVWYSSYGFKVLAALADTPWCYLGRAILHRFITPATPPPPSHK